MWIHCKGYSLALCMYAPCMFMACESEAHAQTMTTPVHHLYCKRLCFTKAIMVEGNVTTERFLLDRGSTDETGKMDQLKMCQNLKLGKSI